MTDRGADQATSRHRTVHLRRRSRRTPVWWRDALGVLCWGSALVVIVLWLSGRGVQLLAAGPADLLTSLGRLSGLVAADLLLVQVFLMARVPMIERSYGQDELARRHRLVGFWSFNLLMVHIALILEGYTLRDHNDLFRETWSVVTTYGGMLLAVAGSIALTVVVVTSVRVARRALRYESWHLLHLYAYVGVGCPCRTRSGPARTSRRRQWHARTGGRRTPSRSPRSWSTASPYRSGGRFGMASLCERSSARVRAW
jgi:hypothetical protein